MTGVTDFDWKRTNRPGSTVVTASCVVSRI